MKDQKVIISSNEDKEFIYQAFEEVKRKILTEINEENIINYIKTAENIDEKLLELIKKTVDENGEKICKRIQDGIINQLSWVYKYKESTTECNINKLGIEVKFSKEPQLKELEKDVESKINGLKKFLKQLTDIDEQETSFMEKSASSLLEQNDKNFEENKIFISKKLQNNENYLADANGLLKKYVITNEIKGLELIANCINEFHSVFNAQEKVLNDYKNYTNDLDDILSYPCDFSGEQKKLDQVLKDNGYFY